MTALDHARRQHADAEHALEDARDRYEAAGWSHLQAPTDRSCQTLTVAAAHFQAAREVLCTAQVRLADAEVEARFDLDWQAAVEATRTTLRRAA